MSHHQFPNDDPEFMIAFSEIQPLFESLLEHKSKDEKSSRILMDKLNKLDKTLQGLSKRSIQFLIDFVSLPLLVLLKFYSDNPNTSKKPAYIERVNESILQVLGTLYHNIISINQDLFQKSIDSILKFCDSIHFDLINRYEKNDKKKYVSDEILIGLSRTCSGLFRNYNDENENGNLLSSREMFPSYGYLIYKFLEMASKDRNRNIQFNALEAVYNFVNNVNNIEIVSNILPGLISSVVKIITGDYKQGNKVFVYAFKILHVSIVKTMNNKDSGFIKETISTEESINILKDLKDRESQKNNDDKDKVHLNDQQKSRDNELIFVKRDRAWFKKASYFVNKSLNQIFSISRIVAEEQSRNVSMAPIIFDNPSTRMALVEAACMILKNCFGVLKDSVSSLIEILILHTFDEYKMISNYAKKEMESFIKEELSRNKINTSQRNFLFNSISSSFFRCVSTLPRIIRFQDDERKLISLKLFAGYLFLLQDKIDEIFITKLPKIASTLYSMLSFDMTDIRVVRKRANILMIESSMEKSSSSQFFEPTKFIYNFEHFKDPRIQSFISLICRIIGRYCNDYLFDFFLQEIKSDSNEHENPNKKEALFIMNELILGGAGIIEKPDSLPDHDIPNEYKIRLSSILFDYISPNVWNTFHHDSNDIRSSYEHILSSSLLLEGVGNIAQVLGNEFDEKMMYVIYPILVKLGDSTYVVNNASFNTLTRISLYCEYKSIIEMIHINTDYIINSIYTNMRYLKDYSSSLLVLHAIIRHASESIIPILMDIIDEIFRGLDSMSIEYQHSFLKILHDIVILINKKIPGKIEDKSKYELFPTIRSFIRRCDEENNKEDLSLFIDCLLEARKEREESLKHETDMDAKEYFTKLHESKENEEDMIDDGDNNDDLDEKEVDHPEGYDFVKSILEKMQHFTSVSNLESRMIVLDIIDKGLYVLSEDEKVLLPTCHTLWDSLKYRFIDTDNRIMVKALEIMKTMSILTKDFVKVKFRDDLWPILKSQIIIYNTFNKESKQIKRNDVITQYTPFTGAIEIFGYSSSFRIQSSILNCLIIACKYLSLHESTLIEIVQSCWFYLSSSQPKQLQQLSIELFSEICVHIPGFIWMLLIELTQKTIESNNPSLPTINPKKTISNQYKIPETLVPQFYSQFHKNADLLLSKHYTCPIIKGNLN